MPAIRQSRHRLNLPEPPADRRTLSRPPNRSASWCSSCSARECLAGMPWLGGCGRGESSPRASLSLPLTCRAAWRPFPRAPRIQVGAAGRPYAARVFQYGCAGPALPFNSRPSSHPPERQNGLAASEVVATNHWFAIDRG